MPTWNYLAVHAYGGPEIIAQPARVRTVLERLAEERLAAAAALRETGGAQAREMAALMESPDLDP